MAIKKAARPIIAKTRPSAVQQFMALSDAEKEAQYSAVDREFSLSETQPLSPEDRKLWEKAKRRKPGRPRVGAGAEAVLVTVEKSLLDEANQFAKVHGLSRSKMVAKGLRLLIDQGR